MFKRSGLLGEKRGGLVKSEVVFILLNIAFFSLLIFFVARTGSEGVVSEEPSAKQLALLVDGAKPKMTILVKMEEEIKLARENGLDDKDIVSIDEVNEEIVFRIARNGGYSYGYVSDYDVKVSIDDLHVILNIDEKPEGVLDGGDDE